MKILLTGANGYIGRRLLPALIINGHQVVCCVRDKNRFNPPPSLLKSIQVIEVDFLKKDSLYKIPKDIVGAYYLIHSMSSSSNFKSLELLSAKNFRKSINKTSAKHVVFLSGITNKKSLSKHLSSRKAVENELSKGDYHFTTLRAGIIIGSGSASFEIIRDLIEKLPIMIAPKWLKTKCQPIGIADVIGFLTKTLFNQLTYEKNFDIGGPDILTYKEMLLCYAKIRGLKRKIYVVPVMTPKLSSYWLYFVTSTSYRLASALVDSMKIEVVCRDNELNNILNITPIKYENALHNILHELEYPQIVSSIKGSDKGTHTLKISDFINTPTHGCLINKQNIKISDHENCIDNLWSNVKNEINFWRVLYANKKEGRLLLFAEKKFPGEVWLDFKIKNNQLYHITTFRPKGLFGRLYYYTLFPVYHIIIKKRIKKIAH